MSDPTSALRDNEPTQGPATLVPSMPRRKFLTTSSVGGLALMAGVQKSEAFFFFGGKSNLNVDDLPNEWVKAQGDNLNAYARHIAKYRLEKITVHDVIKAHARQKGSTWNSLPPRQAWKNMGPTLQAADRLTIALGCDLTQICSAYRSPAYNSRCPGAKPRSYHKQNVALDLMFNTSTARVSRVARELRNNGLFKGGVGRYSLFTHVDTRGYNADW